ncbi:MAG: MarR family transcriptional regulator [Burkholderiales bacterium]|nr:MarR family transcriptional regulator [Burkholderiales bacterium]MDE1927494.1 MarR family transcriptional regulator [Burkholderiales bacterium]MDE2157892.1 MarR family transcriptional regulator [Burkholderiales bacterium]MDE2502292.1 MarR family transcriptional regulator [Burkholderiales bacterium]
MATAPRRGPDTLDTESRTSDEDHLALRLWLRLLACTNRVEAPLRQRLREQFEGSLPRFDLMAQLERHPGGLRMNELSARLMVTGGNVTGLTDRLVAEGLVDKRTTDSDRRACIVALTPAGRRQFAVMARAHESWLVELLGGLSASQQKQLYELLGQLKSALPSK